LEIVVSKGGRGNITSSHASSSAKSNPPPRRSGQLLKEPQEAKGVRGNPGGQGAKIVQSNKPTTQTLRDLGILKQQSSDWQKLAGT
jgi:hypothetical protein